jgi:hypothetical protein
MSIIVSKPRLIEFQQSIVKLSDEVREGYVVDIRRLEDAVINVVRSFAELNPSNNTISETDKFSVNEDKLRLLHQSITYLADQFVEGRCVDVRETERRIIHLCICWFNLGKT